MGKTRLKTTNFKQWRRAQFFVLAKFFIFIFTSSNIRDKYQSINRINITILRHDTRHSCSELLPSYSELKHDTHRSYSELLPSYSELKHDIHRSYSELLPNYFPNYYMCLNKYKFQIGLKNLLLSKQPRSKCSFRELTLPKGAQDPKGLMCLRGFEFHDYVITNIKITDTYSTYLKERLFFIQKFSHQFTFSLCKKESS